MPNPPVPAELKRRVGNPGKRPLPEQSEVIDLDAGHIEPLRPLGPDGRRLWDDIFGQGRLWVSGRTDSQLMQMVCEQIDRRSRLLVILENTPEDRASNMSVNEVEKLIAGNLALLGFTPTDRTRLGVAEVKRSSKLEELMRRSESA